MWIENQDGDLLNASRFCKIERFQVNEGTYAVDAIIGAEESDERIIGGLTRGESNAFMATLSVALETDTYFDANSEIKKIRGELALFLNEDDPEYIDPDRAAATREAEGEAHGTQH